MVLNIILVVKCTYLFSTDFMSLEIEEGFARLLVDYGTGTVSVKQQQIKLTDGKSHRVDILWSKTVGDFSGERQCYYCSVNFTSDCHNSNSHNPILGGR